MSAGRKYVFLRKKKKCVVFCGHDGPMKIDVAGRDMRIVGVIFDTCHLLLDAALFQNVAKWRQKKFEGFKEKLWTRYKLMRGQRKEIRGTGDIWNFQTLRIMTKAKNLQVSINLGIFIVQVSQNLSGFQKLHRTFPEVLTQWKNDLFSGAGVNNWYHKPPVLISLVSWFLQEKLVAFTMEVLLE